MINNDKKKTFDLTHDSCNPSGWKNQVEFLQPGTVNKSAQIKGLVWLLTSVRLLKLQSSKRRLWLMTEALQLA